MDENLVRNILTRGTEYLEEIKSKDSDFTHLLSDLEDVLNAAGKETWNALEMEEMGTGQWHLTKLLILVMSLKIATRENRTVDNNTFESVFDSVNNIPPNLFYLIKQVVYAAFALGRVDGKAAVNLSELNKWRVAEENPTIELTPA